MKNSLLRFLLLGFLALTAVMTQAFLPGQIASAEDMAAPMAATSPAADAAAEPAPAPEAAPAAAPTPDKGDTTWMIVATVLVIMMTIPGLALFYGGMVRSKNMLSVLMQVFTVFCLIAVLWVVYGYSLAFTSGGDWNSWIGGMSKFFLNGVDGSVNVETFSKGVVIPEYMFVMFQMTFAAITTALIAGGYAERIKFSAVLVFSALWFTFSYLPIAHMVWFWGGPSASGDPSGFLFAKGALDFAGGTVVHINAGVAGLVAAIVLGKRLGYGKTAMPPHNLAMTMIGASLLWVGWYGFNVGSNLEANGTAALAFVNTTFATAVAALSWTLAEWIFKGKPSLLGAVSGAIAGLVVITPACGFVGLKGALILGAVAGVVCLWAVSWLKHALGYDDALDAFGVHAVGGILGALGTGIFVNPALGGTGVYDYAANAVAAFNASSQFISQCWAVGVAIVWSAAVSFVLLKLIDMTIGLRVAEEAEREGLDISEHGESAYNG